MLRLLGHVVDPQRPLHDVRRLVEVFLVGHRHDRPVPVLPFGGGGDGVDVLV
jgi:hypothetical protein